MPKWTEVTYIRTLTMMEPRREGEKHTTGPLEGDDVDLITVKGVFRFEGDHLGMVGAYIEMRKHFRSNWTIMRVDHYETPDD